MNHCHTQQILKGEGQEILEFLRKKRTTSWAAFETSVSSTGEEVKLIIYFEPFEEDKVRSSYDAISIPVSLNKLDAIEIYSDDEVVEM